MSTMKMDGNFSPTYLASMIRDRFHPPTDVRPSFAGRIVIITGANTGVGFEAAVKFVELKAERLILAVRSLDKGEDAKERIEQRTSREGIVDVWQLDMLDYDSIKTFAQRAEKELNHLDIAVLNAGVAAASFQQSKYGWEKSLQTNVLSTTLLSLLLLPKLRSSKTTDFTPVLQLVSSGNHYLFHDLGIDPTAQEGPLERQNHSSNFDLIQQYSITKLFLEYAHAGLTRLGDSTEPAGKPDVYVISVCPGATKSDLARDNTAFALRVALAIFSTIFQKSTEEGSRTYISGTMQGEKGHGRFWQQDRIREPSPLLTGIDGEKMQVRVWQEIIDALRKDVPETNSLLAAADPR